MESKGLSGKHVRLDMTARAKGKGAPDKGHTTSFSPSKVVHYFPNFRSYFGMEYEQPWNMGKILLELYIYGTVRLYGLIFWDFHLDGKHNSVDNLFTWHTWRRNSE